MKTTMDRAGRVVVPKDLRRALDLPDGGDVEIVERDGVVEIRPAAAQVDIIETPEGPVAQRSGAPRTANSSEISDATVRETLERIRR